MNYSEIISYIESCEQDLYSKDTSQNSKFDMSMYQLMTVANESVLGDVGSSIYTGLTNISFDHHLRAIDNSYNEYVTFARSRKELSYVIKSYIDSESNVITEKFPVTDLSYDIVEVIRPKFLSEFANQVRNTVKNRNINDMISSISRMKSDDVIRKIKMNCVKLASDQKVDRRGLFNDKLPEIPVSNDYVKKAQIYLDQLKDKNKVIDVLVGTTRTVLVESQEVIDELIPILFNNKIDMPGSAKQYIYNCIKSINEIASYLVYSLIVIIKTETKKLISISKVHDTIIDGVVTEAALEMSSIYATDTESLADDLRRGQSSVYSDLSHRLYDYHKSVLENSIADRGVDITALISSHEYNDKVYEDAAKIYIMLSNGLDIISRNSDEYIVVFDHLIEQAGFQLRLEDKHRGILETLDDITLYRSASEITTVDTLDMDTYLTLIHEFDEYDDNIEKIAGCIFNAYEKLKGLQKRFNDNINGEYKNAEAVNQLKIFFEDLEDQFKKITNIVASKLLLRIKGLAACADTMSLAVNQPKVFVDTSDSSEDDYTRTAFEASMEIEDMINSSKIRFAQECYIEARLKRERGLERVIIEDTQPSNPNDNNTKADGTIKTSAKVIDNSEDAQAAKTVSSKASKFSSETLSKAVESIKNWFNKTLTSFKNIITRKYTKDGFVVGPDGNKLTYSEFLKTYKDYLLNKNYTNTEVRILPYQSIDTIYKNIGAVENNINALKNDGIKSVNSEVDMYKKLFTFVPGIGNSKDVEGARQAVTRYITVGNEKPEDVVYKNNAVADWVKSTIPFLEQYETTYKSKTESELKGMETSLENTLKTYQEFMEELFDSIYSVYVEADNTQQQNTPAGQQTNPVTSDAAQAKNNEDTIGIQDRTSWMRSAVLYFSGSVCNVIRDRIQNSFNILAGFSDKANKAIAAKNAENNQENTENNNTESEQ